MLYGVTNEEMGYRWAHKFYLHYERAKNETTLECEWLAQS